MVRAAPNRTEADCVVLEAPHPTDAGLLEFDVELAAAAPVAGYNDMLQSRVGQRTTVRARPEWLPSLRVGERVKLLLEMGGPNQPVQVRPPA
jgi:hypothetical protein